MLNLDYDAVHRFQSSYENSYWDGWDLVLFKQDPRGATSKRGEYINNQWVTTNRISPDSNGTWRFKV